MPPDRAQQVAGIVGRTLEAEPGERELLLGDLCGRDEELRREVESLLQFQEQARDFIETSAVAKVAATFVQSSGELASGEMLGPYRIVSLLGEGGMGEVYLAEDTSLGRKVAIKLVKSGMDRANLIRHFQREEKILASLTHPFIARLYGGAVTAQGIPYFVMEYIEGERLDSYCRRHQLSLRARLELFCKVCAAVAHAHQQLIIHRDLKPSNIRVTPAGEPKLLDFGIAKLLDEETAGAEQTITLGAVMTPEYASPEQVRGERMTTASDVYSLGVVLYQLLTGCAPYRLTTHRPEEISRAITEQIPARPSTAATNSQPTEIRNQKSLRGDLDNIVLMALRKEPERRYSSVGQFSEDIQRHLEGRPVLARRDTAGYRAAKFILRNKIGVSASVLVVAAIVAGLVVALWQARNARRQRDLAQREKIVAQHTSAFLQKMLGAPAPESKGADVRVTDLMEESSRRARTEAATNPEAMADVLLTLGRTYVALGLYPQAETDLRAAVTASTKANGELNTTTATSMAWLSLALMYEGQRKEGEKNARRAVELQQRLNPSGSAELGIARYSLGLNFIANDDPQSAIPQLEQAVEQIGQHLGKNNGYYMATLTGLARARQDSGDLAAAEELYRRAIAVGATVESRYRIFVAQAKAYLGMLLTDKREFEEAERLLQETEQLYREILGEGNSNGPAIEASLGRLYFLKGDLAAAEKEYRQAFQLIPKFFPPEHSVAMNANAYYGMTLTRLGRAAEGEDYLRRALTARRKVLSADHFLIPLTESALGECLLAQQRDAEAAPLLRDGYEKLKEKFGETDPRVAEAYERWQKLPATFR